MGIGFAPIWLRQVSPPLLHKNTLTTGAASVPGQKPVTKCQVILDFAAAGVDGMDVAHWN